jgi:DNA-binding transcriptional regulator YiaG
MMDKREIKELRKNLGLTQKEMAEILKCKISSIEHYEQGVRRPNKVFSERLQILLEKYQKHVKAGKIDKAGAVK